jgi:hypothetical protein
MMKAITLVQLGISAPLTPMFQPDNTRNGCTMATSAKITTVCEGLYGFAFLG